MLCTGCSSELANGLANARTASAASSVRSRTHPLAAGEAWRAPASGASKGRAYLSSGPLQEPEVQGGHPRAPMDGKGTKLNCDNAQTGALDLQPQSFSHKGASTRPECKFSSPGEQEAQEACRPLTAL